MRLRVVHLPVQGELENLVRPYLLVFDRMDEDMAEHLNEGVMRFPELSGGACHGVIGIAGELEIE